MSGSGLFYYPKMVRVQSSGVPYASAKLYFYDTGTVNQKTVYTDEARSIPFTQPVQADSAGQFAPIFIDPTAVYKTTLNTSADVLIETLDPAYDGALSQSQIGAILYPRTAAEISAGVTPTNYFYPEMHAFRYMTTAQIADVTARSLTLDVRAAVQNAISVAQISGGTVYCPRGSYLIRRVAGLDAQFNGIVVPFTNVFGYAGHIKLIGDGHSTVFYAGDNTMTVVRWSDTNGVGVFAIDGNGKTAVSGISLIGSNTAAVGLVEYINHNNFYIEVRNCTEGAELECPSGGQCYYNTFHEAVWQDNTRHVRLRDHAVAKGANANTFKMRMIGGNCGADIDGADTNNFAFASFEGIASGVSPLAVPTAVRTNSVGSLGGAGTADTNLIGCRFEGNTRDLDCGNRRMTILGGTCGSQASGGVFGAVVGAATPDNWIGGDKVYQLRELLIGGAGADSLLIDNRLAAYNATNPQIGTSANASGAFPLENDGSIVVQARQQVASGIQLATGAASLQGLDILGDGSITARAGSRFVPRIIAQAYSASMTIDSSLGNLAEITANNGTAFTINAPTNPKTGQKLTVVIFNTSGGALGAVTWNAIFKLSAWTQPANGNNRAITFYYGGTAWRQINQTGVDVPN